MVYKKEHLSYLNQLDIKCVENQTDKVLVEILI